MTAKLAAASIRAGFRGHVLLLIVAAMHEAHALSVSRIAGLQPQRCNLGLGFRVVILLHSP